MPMVESWAVPVRYKPRRRTVEEAVAMTLVREMLRRQRQRQQGMRIGVYVI